MLNAILVAIQLVLAVVVVAAVLREGGGGYAPIIATFLLAYTTAGYWTGYALGRRLTRPRPTAL